MSSVRVTRPIVSVANMAMNSKLCWLLNPEVLNGLFKSLLLCGSRASIALFFASAASPVLFLNRYTNRRRLV